MTDLSSRALFISGSRIARPSFTRNTILRTTLRALLVSWISMILPAAAAMGQAATTTTTLAITNPVSSAASTPTDPTPVPYKTPITLTATVTYAPTPTPPATTASPLPVTTGLVLFCDASAPVCENNSALGLVQVTTPTAANPNSTATLKLGSGPLGSHTYQAVYRANKLYASSTSNTVTYKVAGTYASSTTIGSTGTVGNYTLSGTVAGVGAVISPGPTGSVSFLDTSAGGNLLGTKPLGTVILSTSFAEASGSPLPSPPMAPLCVPWLSLRPISMRTIISI